MNWLRFRQPFRRWLLRLSDALPDKLRMRLLLWLYPDDCDMRFE